MTKEHNLTPPPLPWLDFAIGERVVIRRREADGFYDAVGYLTEVAHDHVCVETRHGIVYIDAAKMVTGKRIPPPPVVP